MVMNTQRKTGTDIVVYREDTDWYIIFLLKNASDGSYDRMRVSILKTETDPIWSQGTLVFGSREEAERYLDWLQLRNGFENYKRSARFFLRILVNKLEKLLKP